MLWNKKKGFTLGEVLIALTIVGVLAVLIVPGVIKDVNNKSKMSLLRGTITNINNVVQNELLKMGGNDVSGLSTSKILKSLNPVSNIYGGGFAEKNQYTSYNGDNVGDNDKLLPWDTTSEYSVLLKNGVGVGIIENCYKDGDIVFVVDLNGEKDPNIVGVDLFQFSIATEDDYERGIHTGDVGGYFNGGLEGETEKSMSELQEICKDGNPAVCFRLAELSGFDPNYLTEDYTKEDNDDDQQEDE